MIIIKARCEPLFKFVRVRLRYRRILNLHSSYFTSTIRKVKRKHCTQSECILQANSRLLSPSKQMLKHNCSTSVEAIHHLKMRPKVRLLGSTYRYRVLLSFSQSIWFFKIKGCDLKVHAYFLETTRIITKEGRNCMFLILQTSKKSIVQ